MPVIIWQQLGVLALAVLFSLLFTSMNNREQKARKRG
jgi:hypothetical protein